VSVFLQPIYTQTIGSGGASVVTFNNIPQGFTDLMLRSSQRSSSAFIQGFTQIQFNSDTSTNYSYNFINNYANYSGAGRASNQNAMYGGQLPGANSSTASSFASADFYIANYSGSNFKSIIIDDCDESSSTNINFILSTAGLYKSTSPITNISLVTNTYAQYSTFSLYGVLRNGI